jgi:CHAT domain-containing protein
MVLLTACESDLADAHHDEALTLATALLAAGSVCVVGSKWKVYEFRTAIMMFLFHHFLVEFSASGTGGAADALRAAQLWMIDPAREVPRTMPAEVAEAVRLARDDAGTVDFAEVSAWAAFAHQGVDLRESVRPGAGGVVRAVAGG